VLLAMSGSAPVFAGEFRANLGTSFTTTNTPLAGISAAGGYRAGKVDLWLIEFDAAETSLTYHSLKNSSSFGSKKSSTEPTLTFKGYEIGYSLLKEFGGFYIGPGIGYGIAETTNVPEAGQETSSSTFFTATDVHYGVLTGKVSKRWGAVGCDMVVSSFGGLIGGSLLCGLNY